MRIQCGKDEHRGQDMCKCLFLLAIGQNPGTAVVISSTRPSLESISCLYHPTKRSRCFQAEFEGFGFGVPEINIPICLRKSRSLYGILGIRGCHF